MRILTTARDAIESEILPQYIAKRRWFGLKDEKIESTRIARLTDIGSADQEVLLGEIEVKTQGGTSCWLLPFGIHWEDEPTTALPSRLALARVRQRRRVGLLTDGFALPAFAHRFVAALAAERELADGDGTLRFRSAAALRDRLQMAPDAEVNWLAAEQSNSSLIVGDLVMLKMFRRIAPASIPKRRWAAI